MKIVYIHTSDFLIVSRGPNNRVGGRFSQKLINVYRGLNEGGNFLCKKQCKCELFPNIDNKHLGPNNLVEKNPKKE